MELKERPVFFKVKRYSRIARRKESAGSRYRWVEFFPFLKVKFSN